MHELSLNICTEKKHGNMQGDYKQMRIEREKCNSKIKKNLALSLAK